MKFLYSPDPVNLNNAFIIFKPCLILRREGSQRTDTHWLTSLY